MPKPTQTQTAVVEKPKRGRQAKKEEPVVAEPAPVERKPRVQPTKESTVAELEAVMASVETEINRLKEETGKQKGVKFLRSLAKSLRTCHAHVVRVTKQRKRNTNATSNANAGFHKPVVVSKELASFAGWDVNSHHSRVETTRLICNYIKEHNLQNPEDRRQIRVEADPKLQKLLKYDSKTDSKPLTYYSLQSYLKRHYSPIPTPATPVAVVEAPVATPAPARKGKKVVA